MNALEGTVRVVDRTTLPDLRLRAVSVQAVLLAASAIVLPAMAHRLGLPVRWLLPMHWAVILSGLTYGSRAGATIGVLAPILSFLLSGMPLPHIIPAMTLELATYGFVAGFARQILRLSAFASTAVALGAGRLVFLMLAVATGAAVPSFSTYLWVALVPGLLAASAQLLLLPPLATWWVRRESRRQTAA